MGNGIFEKKIDWGPGYRIYFGEDGKELIILLGGGSKKRQQTEIHAAHSNHMALTRDFKETVRARAARDAAFRRALLAEAIDSMLAGDVATGKAVLLDFINATVGFKRLADDTQKSPKSLMRMLGDAGNPQANNLFEIVAYLQKREKLRLTIKASAR